MIKHVFNRGVERAERDAAWHRFDEIPPERLTDPTTIPLNLSGGWQEVPPHISSAAKEAIDDGFLKIRPVPEFNEAVAEKFDRDWGVTLDPRREVIPCHGAGDGLFAIASVLLNPGDEVITFTPGFTYAFVIPAYFGATVKAVPLSETSGWTVDAEDLERAIADRLTDRTRLFVLVNPANPTGNVFDVAFLARLGTLLRDHGVVVVEDHVYEKVVYPPARFVPMAALPGLRESTVSVSSFAKGYLCAGMKVGYITGPAQIIHKISHYYMLNSFMPNAAALRTAVAILRGPQEFLARWREEWNNVRLRTLEILNSVEGIRCVPPLAGTYCFVDVSRFGTGGAVAEELMQRSKVLVTPGSYYGPTGGNYIRVCYGRTEPARTMEGLQRIKDTLGEFGRLRVGT